MTKDYAKRKRSAKKNNTRSPRQKAPAKKPLSPILVFLGGIFITLIVVFLWAMIKKPDVLKELLPNDKEHKTVLTDGKNQGKSQQSTDNSKAQEQKKDPEFTYHEALTNKEVDVDVTKPKTSNSDRTYIMQCGAFRTVADAESMKAELAFIGFQANVLSKGGWHRVRLGPYKSKRNAESDRHKMQDNNYQNCQIW